MSEQQETVNDGDGQGPVNPYLVHKPLTGGKRFYVMEFVAERLVQVVAFVSIAAILGIFYYVFQEATWAFRGDTTATSNESVPGADASTNRDSGGSGNQSMNDASSDGDSDTRPETYSPDGSGGTSTAVESGLRPEPYDAALSNTQVSTDTVSMPERYGETAGEAMRPEVYEGSGTGASERNGVSSDNSGAATTSSNSIASGAAEHQDTRTESLETATHEGAVKLRQLIAPNDTIDGVPQYIWQPISTVPKYSFVPLFLGALKVTLIGLAIAAPLAILAALFTTAFAPRWMREILKPAIEILAGFPSVVIGFFCLMTVASVVQSVAGTTFRLNAFVGGLGMALAVIPIVYTVTEDALSAVPKHMKEASLALGSSRWQTAFRVVLPAAIPGVFAAVILGFGRAFGETMIALMATGNAALVSADIFESVRTMSATVGAEMAEVEFHSVHYGLLFLIGAVLFVVTFSLNALAEFVIRKRLMKRFQGL